MDRNFQLLAASCFPAVALRKESVDRNRERGFEAYSCDVALRKESVDRNWSAYPKKTGKAVALRKESVDRNSEGWQVVCAYFGSLSARRAWIEIF